MSGGCNCDSRQECVYEVRRRGEGAVSGGTTAHRFKIERAVRVQESNRGVPPVGVHCILHDCAHQTLLRPALCRQVYLDLQHRSSQVTFPVLVCGADNLRRGIAKQYH